MVRQIRKRKEPFAPISQRQLGEIKEEEEEVSRVENVCCSTSNNSDMSTRKRRREEVSDSTREEGRDSVEGNGATPRKQRKYDSAAETGQSAVQQRGKKRKYTEEPECESPVVKKRTVKSSSEEDDDTTRKQSRYYTARETGQSSAEQRGKKRKYPAESECESPVVKKRTVHSSSEEDGKTLSRYYTARETVQPATEQRGKKRKSTEEPRCESPVMKKGRTDKAGVSRTTLTHSTRSKEDETASLSPQDFVFHKIIGEGGYGKVVLATHCDSGRLVAVKIVHKSVPFGDEPDMILNERIALEKAGGSLFCDHAYATFQTEDYIFYVTDYMRGGDLFDLLETMNMLDYSVPFELPTLRLLAAELVCGLQHLHSRGIVHRDIKIDNILVDSTGHVKIADYGIAVTNVYGFNMVTEYLGFMPNGAPEMYFEIPYDGAVDYFALGVFLFELIFPYPLYKGHYGNPKNIMYEVPCYPDDVDPDLKDFLEKLLCKDPCRRNDFIADIQDHPFFNGINWKELEAGEAPPPFFVQRKGFRNLTRETIKPEDLMNNMNDWGDPIKPISAEKQKLFDGFSFVSDEWKAMQKLK